MQEQVPNKEAVRYIPCEFSEPVEAAFRGISIENR